MRFDTKEIGGGSFTVGRVAENALIQGIGGGPVFMRFFLSIVHREKLLHETEQPTNFEKITGIREEVYFSMKGSTLQSKAEPRSKKSSKLHTATNSKTPEVHYEI